LTETPHQQQWDERHAQARQPGRPAEVLLANLQLLPETGTALDLACGRGVNALLLAEQGLQSHAWDFSETAIGRVRESAAQLGLDIHPQIRDVVANPPQPDSFDVILVSHFLERSLIPHLIEALRSGGRIFYQTFVRQVNLGRGPSSPEWRLEQNELLHLFRGLTIHYYREDGALPLKTTELSDMALLVASKTR